MLTVLRCACCAVLCRVPAVLLGTADLLLFTSKLLKGGTDITGQCLQALCDRLAAICLLREATQSRHQLRDLADSLDSLLRNGHIQPGARSWVPSQSHRQNLFLSVQ